MNATTSKIKFKLHKKTTKNHDHYPSKAQSVKDMPLMNNTMYDLKNLDKWDEDHLYPKKALKSMIIKQRVSVFTEQSCLHRLKYNALITHKMSTIKEFQANKSIQELCKSLQQETSNVLAKNISLAQKHFDFERFRNRTNDQSPCQPQSPSLTQCETSSSCSVPNKSILKTQDELYKVGNDLQVRKKVVFKSNENGYINTIENNENIRIQDRTLKKHNLEIEGNYKMVLSSDYYKSILKNKKKLEKTYQDEIITIIKDLSEKETKVKKLQVEQNDLYKHIEEKRKKYIEAKDIVDIYEREHNQNFNEPNCFKGSQWNNRHKLLSQLKMLDNEYKDVNTETSKRLCAIDSEIANLKSIIKSLSELKQHNLKSLIDYYLDLLLKGIDVREIGLVWVIIRLNELGAKVVIENFPKFLDYISVRYLLDYSDKAILIKKLKLMMHFLKSRFKKEKYKAKMKTLKNQALPKSPSMKSLPEQISKCQMKNNSEASMAYINHQRESVELEQLKFQIRNIKMEIASEENENSNESRNNHQSLPSLRKNKEIYQQHHYEEEKNHYEQSHRLLDDLTYLKTEINQTEEEMTKMKSSYLKYFKSKFDPIKLRGISECVRYDLMFSALFGNHAVI